MPVAAYDDHQIIAFRGGPGAFLRQIVGGQAGDRFMVDTLGPQDGGSLHGRRTGPAAAGLGIVKTRLFSLIL